MGLLATHALTFNDLIPLKNPIYYYEQYNIIICLYNIYTLIFIFWMENIIKVKIPLYYKKTYKKTYTYRFL